MISAYLVRKQFLLWNRLKIFLTQIIFSSTWLKMCLRSLEIPLRTVVSVVLQLFRFFKHLFVYYSTNCGLTYSSAHLVARLSDCSVLLCH